MQETRHAYRTAVRRFYGKVLTAVALHEAGDLFGPRMDWLGCGGAPLPLPVAQAYQAAGICLTQGYGLTESSPVISFNRKDRNKLGTVGPPTPGVEVAIAPDGEVLTRGPHV